MVLGLPVERTSPNVIGVGSQDAKAAGLPVDERTLLACGARNGLIVE